jgi:hypothetical protein
MQRRAGSLIVVAKSDPFKLAIKALSPGEKVAHKGVIAERLRDGDVKYSINVMVDRRRIHRTIGTEKAGASLGEAKRAIEVYRTRAREGRLSLPKGRKIHKTLAEAGEEYLERLSREGGKNLSQKRIHFRRHLVPKLGRLPIDDFTLEKLISYRTERAAEGASEATINRELATLSHFFSMATSKDWKWLSKDDVPTIPKTLEPKQPFYILEPEDVQSLLAAAGEDRDPDALLFVRMIARVGDAP